MNPESTHQTSAARWCGPILIITCFIATAAWTWGTWPDAMYDFGSQLYYAWQIAGGKKLYVDIAYFNGPLSQYFNALMLKLFGVGLRTLVMVNLTILCGLLVLLYRMFASLADRFTATAACLVFIGVFAFSQYVGIGNYNWICPYTHEVTHGVALSVAMVAAMGAFFRAGRSRWLWITGILLGLVFLTKAEIFAPAVIALAGGLMTARTPGRKIFPVIAAFVLTILTAFLLLLSQISPIAVGRALLGSWPWVFDSRIAQLQFYRQGVGIDDVEGNLWRLAAMVGVYSAMLGAIYAAAMMPRRMRGVSWMVVGLVIAAVLIGWQFMPDLARPWPVLVGMLALCATWQAIRFRTPHAALRAMLAILSLGLMGKMLLNARIAQYGFALAMPAAMVLVDALLFLSPSWIQARGGDARFARSAGASVLAAIVGVHLYACHLFIADKTSQVAGNADHFLAGARGVEVEVARKAIDRQFPANATLAVMPQGLMLNYLARRENPSPYVNLMPPEMISAGEDRVLAALKAHPPDVIVLVRKDLGASGFILTEGRFEYGQRIIAWVKESYQELGVPKLPGRIEPQMGLEFMKSRMAKNPKPAVKTLP